MDFETFTDLGTFAMQVVAKIHDQLAQLDGGTDGDDHAESLSEEDIRSLHDRALKVGEKIQVLDSLAFGGGLWGNKIPSDDSVKLRLAAVYWMTRATLHLEHMKLWLPDPSIPSGSLTVSISCLELAELSVSHVDAHFAENVTLWHSGDPKLFAKTP